MSGLRGWFVFAGLAFFGVVSSGRAFCQSPLVFWLGALCQSPPPCMSLGAGRFACLPLGVACFWGYMVYRPSLFGGAVNR
ncbi:hypothetical protein, partial [uncultured Varibaculum sp.]|uniref:hypothetical protein n=1 Tax=uncultured Varibaculum sp. TaxID=413896 RepID=UPI002674C2FB